MATGELRTTTSLVIKHCFVEEIQIFSSDEEATEKIRGHPQCPSIKFAFTGECEIDLKWYYIAGNGSIGLPETQIVMVEK